MVWGLSVGGDGEVAEACLDVEGGVAGADHRLEAAARHPALDGVHAGAVAGHGELAEVGAAADPDAGAAPQVDAGGAGVAADPGGPLGQQGVEFDRAGGDHQVDRAAGVIDLGRAGGDGDVERPVDPVDAERTGADLGAQWQVGPHPHGHLAVLPGVAAALPRAAGPGEQPLPRRRAEAGAGAGWRRWWRWRRRPAGMAWRGRAPVAAAMGEDEAG